MVAGLPAAHTPCDGRLLAHLHIVYDPRLNPKVFNAGGVPDHIESLLREPWDHLVGCQAGLGGAPSEDGPSFSEHLPKHQQDRRLRALANAAEPLHQPCLVHRAYLVQHDLALLS